jgi:hypothetical protein
LQAFPRQGSDGSWANRLWYCVRARKHIGPLFHDEIEAIECGLIGSFGPVSPPGVPATQSGLFAWADSRSSPTQAYALKVDSNGSDQWTDNGVLLSNSGGGTITPAICSDGSGGAFIVFTSQTGGVTQIYVQHLDGSGGIVSGWPANGLQITSTSGTKSLPSCVPDGQGGCLFAYTDANTSPARTYAGRINPDGSFPSGWSSPVLVFSHASYATGGSLGNNALVPDLAGGAYFFTFASDGGNRNTYAQRILSDGTKPAGWDASIGVLVSTGGGTEGVEVVGLVLDGIPSASVGAILCYVDGADVYVRRINSDGTFAWSQLGVAPNDASIPNPSCCADNAGGIIVVWDQLASSQRAIYGQRVDNTGQILWSAGGARLSNDTPQSTSTQSSPKAVSDLAGGVVALWYYDPDTSTDPTARVQHLNASGARQWGDSGAILNTGGGSISSGSQRICADGSGGAYCIWTTATSDLAARRVDLNGVVQWAQEIEIRAAANAASAQTCAQVRIT